MRLPRLDRALALIALGLGLWLTAAEKSDARPQPATWAKSR